MIRRVIETLRLPKKIIAASLMDYAQLYCTTRRRRSSIYSPDGSLRSLCGELGLRNSKLGTQAEVPTLTSGFWKAGDQCISLVSKAVIQLHKRKT
jgi:hypothetical protein